jgi:hypothetical protein
VSSLVGSAPERIHPDLLRLNELVSDFYRKNNTLPPPALLPVPQVKLWQLHMFPDMLMVLQFMPNRLSIEPPTLWMPLRANETGNTNTCLT